MLGLSHHTQIGGRGRFTQMLAGLALLAMLLRALLPQGVMLAPQQDGGPISVQLCSDAGMINLLFDPATGAFLPNDGHGGQGSGKSDKSSSGEGPCVFAAIAHLAAPVLPLMFTAAPLRLLAATFETAFIAPGLGLAAPPPFSTGPPRSL